MGDGLRAPELLDPTSWVAVAFWAGVAMVGLALMMMLLDWGPLSTGRPRGGPRRRVARLLLAGGGGLVALALVVGALVG